MYWRAADGLEIRLAAGERDRDTKERRASWGVSPAVLAFFSGVWAR